MTGDLDFVADAVPASLKSVGTLDFGGEATEAPNGAPVDFIVRSDDFEPLYSEALNRAVPRFGLPVPVVGPEYLVAMKMVAARGKDMADLEFLLASGTVDTGKARGIIHPTPPASSTDCSPRSRGERPELTERSLYGPATLS